MLIFVDESGCPGFKLGHGSDRIFGIGMVLFADGEAADKTETVVRELHRTTRHKTEFKFSKCSDGVRDQFFEGVRGCPFRVRTLIADKTVIYSKALREDPRRFYSFFAQMLMRHDNGHLLGARVRIDGSGGRKFRQGLNAYMRRELGERILDIKMVDSRGDQLIQLADMCIGAVTRAYRDNRDEPDRWKKALEPRIDDVWLFDK